jgi:hypothetical protein
MAKHRPTVASHNVAGNVERRSRSGQITDESPSFHDGGLMSHEYMQFF